MKAYKIHLIRHGMTAGNKQGKYIGITNIPVLPEGLAELEKLKETHGYPEVKRVFCSPLLRCTQTAALLYPEHKIEAVDGFTERNFGVYEGKTAALFSKHGLPLREHQEGRDW